jgi:hypothetical protein
MINSAWANNLDLNITCPDSVKNGGPLNVTVNMSNNTEDSITVANALVGIGGNASNTLSGIGLFGPFNRSLNVTIASGNSASRTVQIIDKVPANMKGKMAMAIVALTSSDFNKGYGTEKCGQCSVKYW